MKNNYQDLLKSLPKPVLDHIEHLERMRQDFVANVSHELRTPLTVIHGYLESLLDHEISDTTNLKKILQQMYQQSERMSSLIEDLLLLSRLESDDDKNRPFAEVKVAEILEIICNEARTISGDMNHQITLNTNSQLTLDGNPEELRSLFSNIIFNAIKYTPAGGKVNIDWDSKNQQKYFRVTDTGIGILATDIPRITERFYRVDKARSRDSGGTGLGLAIVKHVLIRHKGKLEIQSELGKGSVFSCIFPP